MQVRTFDFSNADFTFVKDGDNVTEAYNKIKQTDEFLDATDV